MQAVFIIDNLLISIQKNEVCEFNLIDQFKQLRKIVTNPLEQKAVQQYFDANFSISDNIIQPLFEDLLQSQSYQLPLFVLQFLCNFITKNKLGQQYLMKDLKSENLAIFYKSQLNVPQILKCSWVFIYNMIKNNDQANEILFSHPFFSELIKELLNQFFQNSYHDNDSLKQISVEWITYLFTEIFSEKHKLDRSFLMHLMNTEEQLINTPIEKFDAVYFFIFHLLQKSLDDRSRNTLISGIVPKSSEIKSMYEMNQNKVGIQISLKDFHYLKQELILASQVLMQVINQEEHQERLNRVVDVMSKIMKLFCLVTFLGGYNDEVQQLFIPDLIKQFLDELSVYKILYDQKSLVKILNKEIYQELFCVYLRLIGNIIHINKPAQKMILDSEKYLKCSLGFTKLDKDQPLMREWSVILLRNLTDGDPLNKDRISQVIK